MVFLISWIAHHQRLWNDVPYQLMPNRSRALNYMYWSFRPKLNFSTWSYLLDDWFFCIRFDKNNTLGICCHKIDMYSVTESNKLYHNHVKTQCSLCHYFAHDTKSYWPSNNFDNFVIKYAYAPIVFTLFSSWKKWHFEFQVNFW